MRRRCALILFAGVAAGCPSLGAYQCETDADCDRSGEVGQCLADAACAYPQEDRCESGWARSPNAAQNPGACVQPEPTPTTSGATGSTGATSTTQPSASSGDPPPGDSTGPIPICGFRGSLSIATADFSPDAALAGFPLRLPITDVEWRAALKDEALGLEFLHEGVVLPYEHDDDVDATNVVTPALWLRLPDFEANEVLEIEVGLKADVDPPAAADVWSPAVVGVWHFSDEPTGQDGAPIRNSVRVGDAGLTQGDMQPEQRVPGTLGYGLSFDGVDDMVIAESSFQGQLDSYSASFWARYDGEDETHRGSFFQRLNGDYLYPRCWKNDNESGAILYCQQRIGESGISGQGSSEPLELGVFFHVTLVRDAEQGDTTLYLAGEPAGTFGDEPGVLHSEDPPYPLEFGHGEWGSLDGVLDEFRVSDGVLSAARVRADFRSQVAPGASVEFSALEAVPCPD